MDIEGIVVAKLQPINGTSAKGTWVKQEVVIEQQSEFNKKLCISFWGDKTKEIERIAIGTKVSIGVNLESREYNGRWYTEVRAWRIAPIVEQPNNQVPQDLPPMESEPQYASSFNDDMPF